MGVCAARGPGDTTNLPQLGSKRHGAGEAKVVLVGNAYVGKTSIIMQFCDKRIVDEHTATIGSHTKNINIKTRNGERVDM